VTQPSNDTETPIAWRGVPQDTPVFTSDGEKVGTVYDVLGSADQDIFHGIVVHLGRLGHKVMVPADHVQLMTEQHVNVQETSAEIHALPEYTEPAEYEVGTQSLLGTGLLKHLGWKREKDR
jgi:uncharacterized protein YrrD